MAPTPPVAQYQLKARSAAGFFLTWHFIIEDVLESKGYVENETILNLQEPSGQVLDNTMMIHNLVDIFLRSYLYQK